MDNKDRDILISPNIAPLWGAHPDDHQSGYRYRAPEGACARDPGGIGYR